MKLESTVRLKELLGIHSKETDGCLWTNHIVFRLKVHYVAAHFSALLIIQGFQQIQGKMMKQLYRNC